MFHWVILKKIHKTFKNNYPPLIDYSIFFFSINVEKQNYNFLLLLPSSMIKSYRLLTYKCENHLNFNLEISKMTCNEK